MESNQQECSICKKVKIICPNCGGLVEVPMKQAVNGLPILCLTCRKEFIFRSELLAK